MEGDKETPSAVKEAFPLLSSVIFVRRLASPTPLVADTTFDIYVDDSKNFVALITTDHADPKHQSKELKSISGQHKFEFINLVQPFDEEGGVIKVSENDAMDSNFFVVTPHKKYQRYYYLANLRSSR